MESSSPTPTGTEAQVCRDIATRQAFGLGKYGTTVADNPLELEAWVQHAYEEALDLSVYLRRVISELPKASRVKHAPLREIDATEPERGWLQDISAAIEDAMPDFPDHAHLVIVVEVGVKKPQVYFTSDLPMDQAIYAIEQWLKHAKA